MMVWFRCELCDSGELLPVGGFEEDVLASNRQRAAEYYLRKLFRLGHWQSIWDAGGFPVVVGVTNLRAKKRTRSLIKLNVKTVGYVRRMRSRKPEPQPVPDRDSLGS